MADRTYKITFEGDNANLLRTVQANVQALQSMEAAAKKAGQAVTDIGQAGDKAGAGLGKAAEESHSLVSGLDGLAGRAAAFAALTTVATEFGEALNSARQTMRDSADDAARLRDTLREVANLQGKGGPDPSVTADFARFRIATGLRETEARKFQEQFRGTLPAGMSKGNITEATAADLAREGGRFAARTGLDGGAAGDLTAMIAQFSKVPNAAAGAAQLGAIAWGLNEGRGNLTPLGKSLANTAGAIVNEEGGPVRSLPELAAILGVASQNANPAAAGTRVQQAFRALNRFDGDRGRTLGMVGITGDDDLLARLEKIAPRIRAANQPGQGGAQRWLWEQGFHNQAENRSLIQLVENLPVIEQRVGRWRALDTPEKRDAAGKEIIAADAAFLKDQLAGQRRVGEAVNDAGQLVRGQGGETIAALRLAAEGRLRAEGKIDTARTNFGDALADGFGLLPRLGNPSSRDRRIDDEAARMLIESGRRVGVDSEGILRRNGAFFGQGGHGQAFGTEEQRRAGFDAAAGAIRQAGGNPIDGTAVLRELKRIGDAVENGHRVQGDSGRNFLPPGGGDGRGGVQPMR